jgi:hypothetical protein
VKLAKCCTPVPGDAVVGFVTRGRGVSVHRGDCVNAGPLLAAQERVVDVEWARPPARCSSWRLQVEALDRHRLLSDITRVLSDAHVNILSASVTTTRDRVAVSRFTFEMGDPKHLGHLINLVRSVEGVYDAYRVHSEVLNRDFISVPTCTRPTRPRPGHRTALTMQVLWLLVGATGPMPFDLLREAAGPGTTPPASWDAVARM